MTTGLIGAPLLPGHSKRSSQVRVHAEALYTADFLSRRTLLFSSAVPPPQPFKQPQHFLWKKKKRKTTSAGSCIPSVHPGFSPLSGGQPGSIGHMTMVWTAKLLLCSGAGGTGCSALHGNQMKALSVVLNLHSKSPYCADYHTWERER